MKCSECGGIAEVVTSRPAADLEGGRIRWRRCRRCKRRWYSWQPPAPAEQEIPKYVVAWSGNDMLIDRARLRSWRAKVSGTEAAGG